MNLFSFLKSTEDKIIFPHMGRRSWRWTFETAPYYFGLFEQMSSNGGEFRSSSRYFSICFSSISMWGFNHFWYDGPHCSFCIGRIHFGWSLSSCKKCENI